MFAKVKLFLVDDNGATAIVAIGTRYARSVDTVSQSYPGIQFALIDATAPKRHFGRNVAVLNFDPEQIGFLAGVAAALKTKTGKVGFVGAPPDDVLERSEPYEAGFRAGVEAASGGSSRADVARGTPVNPTPSTSGAGDTPTPSASASAGSPASPAVEVLAKHLKRDTPAPGKPDGANKTAIGLFEDDDVDVVFGSSGVSQRALFNAARGVGDETWVVGVGADQFQSATEDQKPHILTSVVKRFDTVTYDFLESVAKHAPLSGRHTYGLDEDGIDFVTSGKFLTKRDIAVINGLKDRVESGNIKVPNRLG